MKRTLNRLSAAQSDVSTSDSGGPSSQSTAITVTAEVLPPEESRATGHGARAEIAACNALHALVSGRAAEARRLAEQTCHYAILLGCKLQQIKAATPHGGWEVLFASEGQKQIGNVSDFNFSARTANNYIRAAEGALNCPGLAVHQKKRILALAAQPEIPDELPEAEAEALDRATRGLTLRQLYIDLGIVRAGATERRGMGGDKGHTAPTPEEDLWLILCESLAPLARAIEEGAIALLPPGQLHDLEQALRGCLEALAKIGRR